MELKSRGRRTEEILELLQQLWTGEEVGFRGRFVTLPGLRLQPGPVQTGGPPVWLGGRKPAAIRRAARFASVWLPYMYDPDQLRTSLAQVREQTGEFGRSPQDVRGAIYLWGGVDQAGESRRWVIDFVSNVYQQDFTPLADRYLLHGTPDQVVDRIGQYAEAPSRTR